MSKKDNSRVIKWAQRQRNRMKGSKEKLATDDVKKKSLTSKQVDKATDKIVKDFNMKWAEYAKARAKLLK
jgi:hypothetical protein